MLSLYFFWIQVPKARLLEILELNPHDTTITATEIKSAYKKLSFKYHPDHGSSEEHREKYEQVRKAYKRLKAAQKARESGGSEEDYLDDDGERGVSIPIPLFLRQYSIDHPGRTVFILLIIAFGLPAYLIYHLLFRSRAQKSAARSTGIRSYADYQRYMKAISAYKDQIDLMFSGLGSLVEAPTGCEKPKEVSKGVTRENSPPDCPFQFPSDSQQSGCVSPLQHEASAQKAGDSEELSVKNEPTIKVYFEAVSPSYMAVTFAYIDIIVNTVVEKIIPIDIQNKNKRLLQLYDDKKALIKRINETAWVNGQRYLEVAPPGDEPKKEKLEPSSHATIRILHRTQSRYKIEKDKESQNNGSGSSHESPLSGDLGEDMSEKSHSSPGKHLSSDLQVEMTDKKTSCPYLSIRFLEKLQQIDEEIAQLFADIEKSSFEYLSSFHIRGRKRQEKSKKLKKEKQSARS
ncbi:chaperone protein DNAj [Perkinsela sp. CCAP 1560/4]|nr:chaperone protein DNAj [Perkinsela sp. CCAP 1560/4]|eukprot:KNH06642.1 chaperone protein DNAj [Perkinsela sp. CCAP 1560/4]